MSEILKRDKLHSYNGIVFYLRDNNTAVLRGYTGKDSYVHIPNTAKGHTVTEIADRAFQDCTHVTNVYIPDSITQIGQDAFQNCGRKETVDADLARAYAAGSRRELEDMFGYGYEWYESRVIAGESIFQVDYNFTAIVTQGSYAEQYCRDNKIQYTY